MSNIEDIKADITYNDVKLQRAKFLLIGFVTGVVVTALLLASVVVGA